MNTNEYYILPSNQINKVSHTDIVGNENDVKWNNDKTKFLIKTKEGIKNGGALQPFIPFNQDEIKLELQKAEWTKDIE